MCLIFININQPPKHQPLTDNLYSNENDRYDNAAAAAAGNDNDDHFINGNNNDGGDSDDMGTRIKMIKTNRGNKKYR